MINYLKQKPLFFLLLLAFTIRFTYFIGVLILNPDGFYIYDSNGYWNIAYNLREYGIFSQSANTPLVLDYYRTPIYPFFIFIAESFGIETLPIIILQIGLGVLTCYFTYKLSLLITDNKLIAHLSCLIVALDVPSIIMNNLVMTETLFAFLLITCIYSFVEYLKTEQTKWLICTSILSAIGLLCRPISFFIPIFIALFILFHFRKEKLKAIKSITILLSIVFITISPWLIRNKIAFNHYFLSVIREHDMQNYQAAAIYGDLNNLPLADSQSILRWKTYKEFGKDAFEKPYEYAKYIEKDALDIMFSHPKILLKHHVIQFTHFFLKPCRAYIDIQLGHWGIGYDAIPKDYPIFKYLFDHNSKLTISVVFFQLFLLLICYVAAIFGFFYFKKQKQLFYFFLLGLLIFCFANLTLPYVTESRFRIPVIPFIAISSAAGIYFFKNKFFLEKLMKKQISNKDSSNHSS